MLVRYLPASLDLLYIRDKLTAQSTAPEWRNWQTRQVEGLVGVNPVQVQVLSPAPRRDMAFSLSRRGEHVPLLFLVVLTPPAISVIIEATR